MTDVFLDCKGMVCPLPIAQVQKKSRDINPGKTLSVEADCASFPTDIENWCTKTNHPLISKNQVGSVTKVVIQF